MDTNEVLQKIANLEKRINIMEGKLENNPLPSPTIQNPVTSSKKMSAKEFLLAKKYSGNVQKTLTLAYYLEYIIGEKSINVSDLQKVYQLAKEKAPKNLNDMINKNISKGYLMDATEKKDSKKAWVLTSTGEKLVEDEFNLI